MAQWTNNDLTCCLGSMYLLQSLTANHSKSDIKGGDIALKLMLGSFCVCAQPMRNDVTFVTSCLIGWAHTQNDPCWWNESLKLIETRNIHVCFSSNKIHINISYFLTVIDRNNDIFEKKNKNFVFSHFSWIHSHLYQFLEFYTILYTSTKHVEYSEPKKMADYALPLFHIKVFL